MPEWKNLRNEWEGFTYKAVQLLTNANTDGSFISIDLGLLEEVREEVMYGNFV